MKDILPTQVKADLTTSAELADAIVGTTIGQHIAETSTSSNNFEGMMKQITAIIEAMTMQITAALVKRQDSGRRRFLSLSRSRPRQQVVSRDGCCWYHTRFSDKARKCREPCTC